METVVSITDGKLFVTFMSVLSYLFVINILK